MLCRVETRHCARTRFGTLSCAGEPLQNEPVAVHRFEFHDYSNFRSVLSNCRFNAPFTISYQNQLDMFNLTLYVSIYAQSAEHTVLSIVNS